MGGQDKGLYRYLCFSNLSNLNIDWKIPKNLKLLENSLFEIWLGFVVCYEFYLPSRRVQGLILVASIRHHHHSSLDWQPPSFDLTEITQLGLLLSWGLHYMCSLPTSSALRSRKKPSLEGLLAAQRTLILARTPTRRWTPAESGHGCCPIIKNWNLIMNCSCKKVALHPVQVLQPVVQLASFNGALGPRRMWEASNRSQNILWY